MKEEDGASGFVWRGEEDGVVAVGMEASGDECAGRFVDAETLGGEGDAAVGADAGLGAGAPDVGPPGAARGGPEDGAFFPAGAIPGDLRGGADLPVLLVGVVVRAELVDPAVGLGEGGDVLRGEERRKALLPEVVGALDLALGLRSGRVAQGDLVKAEGGAELGEGVRGMGEEEGVVVDVEGERQALSEEGAGEEAEMRQERFARIEPHQWQQAAVVVDESEQGRLCRQGGEPAVGGGVVLPELADLLDLPAADRLSGLLVAGIGREVLGERPAADGGAVEFERVAAMDFGSGKAAGRGRGGAEELAQQSADGGRPLLALVAAGEPRLPLALAAPGASGEMTGTEHIEAAAADAEFGSGVRRREGLRPEAGQDITDERSRVAAAQLLVAFSSGQHSEEGPLSSFARTTTGKHQEPGSDGRILTPWLRWVRSCELAQLIARALRTMERKIPETGRLPSLEAIELEVEAEGREWTRRRLAGRLQELAGQQGGVFPPRRAAAAEARAAQPHLAQPARPA